MKTRLIALAALLAAGAASAAQPTDGETAYRITVLGETRLATTDNVPAVDGATAYQRFITGTPQVSSPARMARPSEEAYRRTVLGLAEATQARIDTPRA
jgi:hypothetical protein